jgi:hypothetical protein
VQRCRAQIQKIGGRDRRGHRLEDRHQAIGLMVRQRMKQDRVHHREKRGVCSDPECQRGDRGAGKTRRLD